MNEQKNQSCNMSDEKRLIISSKESVKSYVEIFVQGKAIEYLKMRYRQDPNSIAYIRHEFALAFIDVKMNEVEKKALEFLNSFNKEDTFKTQY